MTRIELEEDISRQKNALATERLQAEEQLSTLKQRLKHEEVWGLYFIYDGLFPIFIIFIETTVCFCMTD